MHEINSDSSSASTTAVISHHWRSLKNNSRITQYFYGLSQRHMAGSCWSLAAMLLYVCRRLCIVPLHLFICVATQSADEKGRPVEIRQIYEVSEGNAIATDGAVFGDWFRFPATTPGYAVMMTNKNDFKITDDPVKDSLVSHSVSLKLTKTQLCAMNKLIERCQSNFHYKLVGNNCQTIANDIIEMLRRSSYRPKWVAVDSHNIYLNEVNG